MKLAVVFDSAGTLVKVKRIIKEIKTQKFLCNNLTVDIVDEKVGRALVIIKDDPLKVVDKEDPEKHISELLKEVDWGISYCNKPIDRDGIFKDKKTKVKELQDTLNVMKRFKIQTGYGSAIIVDTLNGIIEYTITTGGCVFPEVPETIKKLKELGVKVFIASGDRKEFIKRLAEITGINEKYIMPEAHQEQKKDLVLNLKKERYYVIMVGDAANDVPAMLESDLSVVTLQNGNISKKALEVAKVKIYNIKEILNICEDLINKNKG
ncbi:HAD family hydrolase [Methanotorris formicicus]|uniref:Haloacid dehalogenase domain protein hydrolase n=1 Tax=Methanotorris formicicus Mc-S-70 TaxID=647171 RepID=H1KX31_9EURY|nr:HAD family hydrolase [Methanotorris formicicus]EHP88556.1 Haloacid dehalogenase domain protein hydrolase [Methanotorris formicicus Mc-S-70]